MKKLIYIFVLLIGHSALSQELNCTVDVNFQQINGVDPAVFQKMKKDIFDFMNNRKWSTDVYTQPEKIECDFFITISKMGEDNASFTASLLVQSSRPIYGTNLKAPMLAIQDDNFGFTYSLNQALEYSDNEAISNLTSVLAFYAYIILAYDYDSYALKGGSDFLLKAQNVLNNNANQAGWTAGNSNLGRFWLIENLLNPVYEPLRICNYNYHRLGMDIMSTDLAAGRQVVTDALKLLDSVNKRKPNSYSMKVFFDAKNRELVSLYSDETVTDRQAIVDYLTKIDPGNGVRYSKILQVK